MNLDREHHYGTAYIKGEELHFRFGNPNTSMGVKLFSGGLDLPELTNSDSRRSRL
jgi:hypothetical protein